ncbi:MAG: STAS domain-containing protein, partial [Desulfovibrionaceae bacterium]
MIDIRTERGEVCTRLTLSGRLDANGQAEFDRAFAPLAEAGAPVVVDMAGVEFLSSAGLRSLIKAEKTLRAKGAGLVFHSLTPFVRQVFEVSGMGGLLRQEADAALAAQTAARLARQIDGQRRCDLAGLCSACTPLEGETAHLEQWGGEAEGETWARASLAELGLGLGRGGFGATREQAQAARGAYLCATSFACLAREDGEPDLLFSQQPDQTHLYVRYGVSISGDPAARLDFESACAPLGAVAAHALAAVEPGAPDMPLALAAFSPAIRMPGREPAPGMILGMVLPEGGRCPGLDGLTFRPGPGCVLAVRAMFTETAPTPGRTLESTLHRLASLENLGETVEPPPDTTLERPVAFVFRPLSARRGEQGRIRVECAAPEPLREEWLDVVRRIFGDLGGETAVARVVLTPLHGGFSSRNFTAEAFDAQGRRLLPSVVKLGSEGLIRRELEAYAKYVKPFILNNSTSVLGWAECNGQAGLAYNFLGVTGAGAKLTWLRTHYEQRPVTEFLPLLRRAMTDVMRPWYGQPQWAPGRPYREHDPRTLFKSLLADAETRLGLGPDRPDMPCPELGRPLPNPYRFQARQWTERLDEARPWYQSIVHNDLNFQYILVDERE